jgi:hypothetical protein
MGQGVYVDSTLNVDGAVTKATGYMTDILTAQAVSFISSRAELARAAHR